jgi:hypothetical protein
VVELVAAGRGVSGGEVTWAKRLLVNSQCRLTPRKQTSPRDHGMSALGYIRGERRHRGSSVSPRAVLRDVAHQVAHVVLQIPDDVFDDINRREPRRVHNRPNYRRAGAVSALVEMHFLVTSP